MRENPISKRVQGPDAMPVVPQWAFFETIAGPGETAYPSEDDGAWCYYAKKLKNVTFTKEVGAPTLTYEYTNRLDYVFNLAQENYIEENSVIRAELKNGRWWTVSQGGASAILGGTLDEALTAPTSVTGTPTTADVNRHSLNSGTGKLDDASQTDTITNFDPSLEGDSGAFVWYTQWRGVYIPLWVGCTSS